MKRSELLTKLARELDSWPQQTTDVPKGMPGMWCYDAAVVPEERGVFVWATHNPGRDDDTINVHDWLAEKKRLASEPEAPEWNGEGLPPVGARVEIEDGCKGTVLAVAHLKRQGERAWLELDDGDQRVPSVECIRPIRSEEDRAVEHMKSVAGISYVTPEAMEIITRALYRAGYRKQEAP